MLTVYSFICFSSVKIIISFSSFAHNLQLRHILFFKAWNPAVEEQCFDRAHRLGQTNDVTIIKVSIISN